MSQFASWFALGVYGGLICCGAAIAAMGLYAGIRTRSRAALFFCIAAVFFCSLLLLPGLLWFYTRFAALGERISTTELLGAAIYIFFWGWMLPLGMAIWYCLFAPPQPVARRQLLPPTETLQPPRYQVGVEAPFVFGEDTTWGWLEYYSGNFQGQRLALKRMIILIGREEYCDIWLDDDMSSRHHAEIAWDQGRICLTDCDSMNGTRVNGKRVRGSIILQTQDLIEIGSHQFLFVLAEQHEATLDDDPLSRHTWRSTTELQQDFASRELPTTSGVPGSIPLTPTHSGSTSAELSAFQARVQATIGPLAHTSPSLGVLLVPDGTGTNRTFSLERPLITIGQGQDCDLVVTDPTVAHIHARVARQEIGDTVQDATGRGLVLVNGQPVTIPRVLRIGDIITIGAVHMEYTQVPTTTLNSVVLPMKMPAPPPPTKPAGPMPLRLPSRRKDL